MKEDTPAKIFFTLLITLILLRQLEYDNIDFNNTDCSSTPHSNVDMYCSYAQKYNIALVLIPKSGSSTGRHLFKHDLGGYDVLCRKLPKDTLFIATVRDPYKRFLSSYDEMFVRRLGKLDNIPPQYRDFMRAFDGFEYKQYEQIFNTKPFDDAFETFVDSYDGMNPFDVHLMAQKDAIQKYNIEIFADLNTILKRVLQPLVPDKKLEYIKGRAYPRRFNVDKIKPKTKKKICQLVKDDYCCLNLPIPYACKNEIQCIHTKNLKYLKGNTKA